MKFKNQRKLVATTSPLLSIMKVRVKSTLFSFQARKRRNGPKNMQAGKMSRWRDTAKCFIINDFRMFVLGPAPIRWPPIVLNPSNSSHQQTSSSANAFTRRVSQRFASNQLFGLSGVLTDAF